MNARRPCPQHEQFRPSLPPRWFLLRRLLLTGAVTLAADIVYCGVLVAVGAHHEMSWLSVALLLLVGLAAFSAINAGIHLGGMRTLTSDEAVTRAMEIGVQLAPVLEQMATAGRANVSPTMTRHTESMPDGVSVRGARPGSEQPRRTESA